MKSATKLTAASLLAVSALVLSGCASGASSEPSASPKSIDLRMTTWTANADQLKLFKSIADEYIASHPEINSITFDSLPFADYTTTLTTQVAGGKAPDLAWILEDAAPDFVASGALADIQDTLSKTKGYEFSDLDKAATALWKNKGKLMAYPFSTSPFVVFANDSLLKAAGEPTSAELQAQGKWNWQTISDIGSVVNQKTGKAGFVIRDFDYKTWVNLASVWLAWGARPWSADGTKCEFDSTKMVDAFTFLHDAVFTKKSMPGPGTTADFFAGDSAFTVTQISRASLLKPGGFAWNLLPLPKGQVGNYAMIGQAAIGVMKQGKHQKAATDFLAFFTNPANSKKLAQYFPPARNSQLNTATLAAANPVLSAAQLGDVVIPAISTGVVRPNHTNSAEIEQKARAALDAIWTPNADIPAVLKNVCTAINPLLKK